MQTCKFCGAIVISGICPVCHRSNIVHPPTLMSATLFNLNPYLKKRLEWREQIRRNTGMLDLPFDPTTLTPVDLPLKTLPTHTTLPQEEEHKKKIKKLEF